MRKAVVAVAVGIGVAMGGASLPAGSAAAPAVARYEHTVSPRVVQGNVKSAALRFSARYVGLRRNVSRAAAARELALSLSVRTPRHGAHRYLATMAHWRSRAAIALRPGYSVGKNGRAVPDRGPKACATIDLAALDRRRPRAKAVRVTLGTVATRRARCIRPR